MATNRSQQNADRAILFEAGARDAGARLSLIWLKAYGVGVIAVAAAGSAEYWKPFSDPGKFDALPSIWSESSVTIRRVPARSTSLAYVLPESAMVKHPPKNPEDSAEAARYVAALEDPSLPLATFAWDGRERMRIRATHARGEVISVQEGYNPGWRATVYGQRREVFQDGLGLMWLRTECADAAKSRSSTAAAGKVARTRSQLRGDRRACAGFALMGLWSAPAAALSALGLYAALLHGALD